jgi:hypothetical protein
MAFFLVAFFLVAFFLMAFFLMAFFLVAAAGARPRSAVVSHSAFREGFRGPGGDLRAAGIPYRIRALS